MSRWWRILLGCGVGVIAILAYLRFFGCQTELAVGARYFGWKTPILLKVPVRLSDQSISKAPGRRLSYLGYEFEVPWDDLDEAHTKLLRNWQVISFKSGKMIVFMGHEPDGALRTNPAVRTFMCEGAIPGRYDYDYAVIGRILDASPNKNTPFMSRWEAICTFETLTLKQLFMLNGESGIFLIETPEFRGFQYGNPESGVREVRDELYSTEGSVRFTFQSRSGAFISQAEINRVLQTVRRIDDQRSDVRTMGAQPMH
jgi:hypothetical protein